MITPEEIKQAAELEYREHPTEVAGSMNYNKDPHCFKKHKAFGKGANWAISKMQDTLNKLQEASARLIDILETTDPYFKEVKEVIELKKVLKSEPKEGDGLHLPRG